MAMYPALALVACLVAAEPKADSSGELPYVQEMNHVFAESDGVGLLMDIFTPTGKRNGLAIVDVASGSYESSRAKLNDHKKAKMFDIFCGKGYTVFAVRPGSRSKFSIAEMLDNVKLGIRWVKAHASEYDIDPNRLGLTGASAGGHLACLAAVTAVDGDPASADPLQQQSTRVNAVVAFFPPTDFLNYGKKTFTVDTIRTISPLFGNAMFPGGIDKLSNEEVFAAVEKLSPARLVTSEAPPFLLFHGTADFLVPLRQSQLMLEALQKAGVPAELIIKQGGGHPWPTIHEEVAVAADWLDKQLLPAQAAAE